MPIKEDDDSIKHRYIYILELECEHFYVGQTSNLDLRIKKHFRGKGSSWTRIHSPVKVREIINLGVTTYNCAEKLENYYTVKYMKEYHWTRVRGGYFCNIDPDILFEILKNHQIKNKVKGIDFV
ncbi:hypothetical protein D5E69_23320 (plasmid) [Rossellomorea marisflavi]|jgi:predicted GIY-YIG superfamily endonuclease|uniref:GIY-YIG nuclease family protein n=1 Tax=Rossellomorea marisflavi TaxID=189381 RepID=UPI0013166D20|nr:GIY-YIG nuclease family protein [Rossellomorea marisflavi]QHA38764.1 hypothetical protein D5E69_23320 [Rossellomorea marisflavi]